MTPKEKTRLHNLKIKIWGKVAKNLRHQKQFHKDPVPINSPVNPYEIKDKDIEFHKGWRPKALRLLSKAGYITPEPIGKYKDNYRECYTYKILRFEESKKFGTKPKMIKDMDFLNKKISSSAEEIRRLGYQHSFSAEEEIYVWWNLKDYDCIPMSSLVYEKSELDDYYKRLLRVIVERRLKEDFPNYLKLFIPNITPVFSEKQKFNLSIPIKFKDFSLNSLKEHINTFEKNLANLNEKNQEFYKALDIIDGNFSIIIEKIRRQIIDDLVNQINRFPIDTTHLQFNLRVPHKYYIKAFFKVISHVKHLCTYENLYNNPAYNMANVKDIYIPIIDNLKYDMEFLYDNERDSQVA